MLLCCLIVLALATLISAQRNNRFNNRQNRQNNGNRGNNNRNVGNRNRQNAGRNNRQNNRNQTPNRNPVINGGRFRATPANARDKLGNQVYPGCNGTVCLPEARLCANRKQKRELLLLLFLWFSQNSSFKTTASVFFPEKELLFHYDCTNKYNKFNEFLVPVVVLLWFQ